MPSLDLSAFVSYVYGKYDEYISKANPTTEVDLSDVPFGGIYAVPRWQGGVAATYRVPLREDLGALSLSIDAGFRSRSPTDNAKYLALHPVGFQVQVEEPGRGVANARIDWRHPMGSPVDVALFVTNLTDRVYQEAGTIAAGVGVAHYAAPRIWGVELRYDFGQGFKPAR